MKNIYNIYIYIMFVNILHNLKCHCDIKIDARIKGNEEKRKIKMVRPVSSKLRQLFDFRSSFSKIFSV